MTRGKSANRITTPELIEKVNPKNKELIKEFIAYLCSLGRAETTLVQYEYDLNIFFVWNLQSNNNKFFTEIGKRDFVIFQGYLLRDNKCGPRRIRRIKSVLSSLSGYIENILDEEYPGFRNSVSRIESPADAPVREKTVLTKEMVNDILQFFIDEGNYQAACFMALAAFSGARKSELLRFKESYFKPENIVFGSLYKTSEKIKTKGKGGGKFIHKYVLAKEFDPYLNLWLEQRGDLGIDVDALFVVNRNGEWVQSKDGMVKRWFEKLTEHFKMPMYCHMFRHFWTSEMQRSNIPDSVITKLCGWDSSDMVSLYSDLTIDDEIGKYFDETGIKSDIKEGKLKDL